MEYPPPSLAVMWFVNVRETKPRSKKKMFSYLVSVFCLRGLILQTELNLHEVPQKIIRFYTQSYRCSVRKGFLRNFTNFTEKHLCQSLFLNKVGLIKKEALAQVVSCEFCEISKNTFFIEYLWATASEI